MTKRRLFRAAPSHGCSAGCQALTERSPSGNGGSMTTSCHDAGCIRKQSPDPTGPTTAPERSRNRLRCTRPGSNYISYSTTNVFVQETRAQGTAVPVCGACANRPGTLQFGTMRVCLPCVRRFDDVLDRLNDDDRGRRHQPPEALDVTQPSAPPSIFEEAEAVSAFLSEGCPNDDGVCEQRNLTRSGEE